MADGKVGEEKMMIDNDEVRLLGPLVHGGDEAALEFRALLAGAKVAACVDAVPHFGTIGKKRELAAVARFGQLLPVADLREPIDFIEPLQSRLALHQVNLLTTQEICSPLHQGGLQIRRKMPF